MKLRKFRNLFTLLVIALTLSTVSWAGQERILRAFNGNPVEFPSSGLIADPSGNLFGVLQGAVYEMLPKAGGGYTFSVIYSFGDIGVFASGNLVRDNGGNLFGSTRGGGTNGCGYIFKLSPQSGGQWKLRTLHNFTCTDGQGTGLGMAMDASGNLFGATGIGGSLNQGVAYELGPGAGGVWTYQVLHNFDYWAEGGSPETNVILDGSGNFYGGNHAGIYKMSPNGDGTWTESTAFTLGTVNGGGPLGDLVFDSAGNIFGTTAIGGTHSDGTVFELSPAAGGTWTLSTLYNFAGVGDGSLPAGGVTFDAAGNIYGTTQLGGGPDNSGTVYRLSQVGGAWAESVLYRFKGAANNDGAIPEGRLYINSNTLLGTTSVGGNAACSNGSGCGTVFAIR